MKKLFTLLFLLFAGISFGQQTSNLVVFSEDGSLFYLLVNGVTQNYEPKSNIKLVGLTNESNQIVIKFAETQKGMLKRAVVFQEMGVESTVKITLTKKGYRLRAFGEVPIQSAPATASGQWTGNYTTTNAVAPTSGTVVPVSSGTVQPVNSTTPVINTSNPGTTSQPLTTNPTTPVNTPNNSTSTTASNTTTGANTNPGGTSINMKYNWTPGAIYRFSTNQQDDVSTSMMGMNMKEKFFTTTEFALQILSVQPNGTANGILYLIDYKVTDSKNVVLASINDIPSNAVKSEVTVDNKGKFTFANRLKLITTANGNVLAYVKGDGNSVAMGGQAGDMQVDAYAEFNPGTGQLKATYNVKQLNATRKVTVKVTQETDELDVLPYDYLEFLALPEGTVSQGQKTSMRSGIYTVDCIAQKIENGNATLNYQIKTDKSKDMFTGDVKSTDPGGNQQFNMGTDQMVNPSDMMTNEDKTAMGTMKDMSPQITCTMNSEFSYAIGMFNQVSGVMTTTINAMGVQFTVVSNLTMKKL